MPPELTSGAGGAFFFHDAGERVNVVDSGRLNGVFLGFANRVQASTRVRTVVDAQGSRWRVERLGDKGVWMEVITIDPEASLHDAELIAAIELIGGDGEPIGPATEPPKPVQCPECFGIESMRAHCDRCQGAGVVPG